MTTPPIPVKYAFASVLGPDANSISALAAATAGGYAGTPGLPCGLCLLDPVHSGVLAVAGSGDVVVEGGGITVASSHPDAAILSDSGTSSPTTTAPTKTATIYAANARLLLASSGNLVATHPLVLARLLTLTTGSISVTLDPPTSAAATSGPVLIR